MSQPAAYQLLSGDARARLAELPEGSAQTCVTSPPYFKLRSYLPEDHPDKALELGTEETVEAYVAGLVEVFAAVARVLRPDGTLWLNLGDSFATGGNGGGGWAKDRKAWQSKATRQGWKKQPPGLKHKDLIGIPWRVALALQAAGWWLRSETIWYAKNKAPEGNIQDRLGRKHETVFLLARAPRYFFDLDAIREPCTTKEKRTKPIQYSGKSEATSRFRPPNPKGKNPGTVWCIPTESSPDDHFAVMPEELARRCVLAGSRRGDVVLDPFAGSGTTGAAAIKAGRDFVGIDLKPEYITLARERFERCSTGLSRKEQKTGRQNVLFGEAG